MSRFLLRPGAVLTAVILVYTAAAAAWGIHLHSPTLWAFVYCAAAFAAAFLISSVRRIGPVYFLCLLAGFSFALYLTVALRANTEQISDFLLLYQFSESLRNGDLGALHSSGYFMRWAYQSLFVIYQAVVTAVFPGGQTPLLVMNAVFCAGITVMIYLLARSAYGERGARTAALLYLFFPAPFLLVSTLTNQHISMFFALLAIWALTRKQDIRHGLVSGALFALSGALRPDADILLPAVAVLAVFIFLQAGKFRERLGAALPYIVCAASILLTGLLISLLVMASGVNPNGQRNGDPLWKFVLGLDADTAGGYSQALTDEVFSIGDDGERRDKQAEIIRRHLSGGKRALAAFFAEKASLTWRYFEDTYWAFSGQDKRLVFNTALEDILHHSRRAERTFFIGAALLAAVGAVWPAVKKDAPVLIVLCGIVIILLFFVFLAVERQPRYRYIFNPFVFVLAGAGADAIVSAFGHLRRRRGRGQ